MGKKDDEWMDELVDDLAQKQTIFILPFVVVFFVSLEKKFVRGSILGRKGS